jgi:hypothetical protein
MGAVWKCIKCLGGKDVSIDRRIILARFLRKYNIDRAIILKRFLKKYIGMARTGFIWLRIGTSGDLL